MFTDTHCHLHDREFYTSAEQEEMLERARKKGVLRIICIGTNVADSLAAREFARDHRGVFWTFGVHPGEARDKETARIMADEARKALGGIYGFEAKKTELPVETGENLPEPPVAIGEVGLDYHYEGYDREAQIKLFEEMLQLAVEYKLPVSFHVREAFEDFFAVVRNFPGLSGVVHSFSDNKKNLRRILEETEFFVGVNGMATYSTLPLPPLSRIVLETDAPFLTPEPVRGEKNEPANVRYVAEWLAKKLGEREVRVNVETMENAGRLFGI